jgi:hypothetical protein
MNEDIEEKPLDSSTSEGATDDTTPLSTEDDSGTGPSPDESAPEKAEPKAPRRAELIKNLTEGNQAEEEDDEDESEDEGDEPEAKEESKVEDVDAEPEGNKHDTSDKRSKAEKRFEVLTGHNKELKTKLDKQAPFVDYAQKVLDFCKDAGVSTAEVGIGLSIVATAKKDPAAAALYLEKLGIKPREVVQTVKEIPQELDDKILELVTDGQMTPEGAKAILGITRAARASAPPKQPEAPKPAEQPKQATQTSAPSFDPNKANYDRELAKAVADIDSKATEYATRYPADWPKLAPQITEAMKLYQGTRPATWLRHFENEVAKAVASVKSAPTSKANQPLRPSTQTSQAKAPPNGRKALVAGLVTGKLP